MANQKIYGGFGGTGFGSVAFGSVTYVSATLAVQDSSHNHASSGISLTVHYSLQPNSSLHAHTAEGSFALSVGISPSDAHHSHYVDNTTIRVIAKKTPPAPRIFNQRPRMMKSVGFLSR